MKKFKFRLERVRQHRALVKSDRKRELALQNILLREEQGRLEQLNQALLLNNLQLAAEDLPAQQVYLIGLYGARLQREIEKQTEVEAAAQSRVAEALARYVEAAQEAEALETLKKHRLEEYWDYVFKEEGKFLDELTIQRAKANLQARLGGADEAEEQSDHDA